MTTLRELTVRGSFRGASGHDHHVREFVRELHRQGIAVSLQDLPLWHPYKLPEDKRDGWFDSLDKDRKADLVLHFCMPHQVIRSEGKSNVNYTMFEAARVPTPWIRENRKHELVIVPAESSRQAWLASGMPQKRLRVCPLGINPELFCGTAEPMELTTESGMPLANYGDNILDIPRLLPHT